MAELVDVSDLGSDANAYGFESFQVHHMDCYPVWEVLNVNARVGSTPTQSYLLIDKLCAQHSALLSFHCLSSAMRLPDVGEVLADSTV